MFTIYSDTQNGSTIVSNLFIDEYMKDANDAQIKIYLYLLRALGSGIATSVSDMADRFNHTEKDVIRSLRYWEKCGLLSIECDSCGNLSGVHMLIPQQGGSDSSRAASRVVSIAPALEEKAIDVRSEAASSASSPAASGTPVSGDLPTTNSRTAVDTDALRSFREDKKRETLLFVIEQYIGKPLSVAELRTVCYISETLHFSDDLIDYLVQYCVDRGKKDFRYIEKVAVNWSAKGITTPSQAVKKASDTRKGNSPESAVRTKQGTFGHFEQRDYDWETLEQKILNS